jgi:hypothetical protein
MKPNHSSAVVLLAFLAGGCANQVLRAELARRAGEPAYY